MQICHEKITHFTCTINDKNEVSSCKILLGQVILKSLRVMFYF